MGTCDIQRYARAQRTSVSRLVEGYLQLLGRSGGEDGDPPPPGLRALRGLLRRGSPFDYRRHIIRKYRGSPVPVIDAATALALVLSEQ